jgi:hypothetical protein
MPSVLDLVQRFFDRALKGAEVDVDLLPDEAVTLPARHQQSVATARTV